MAVSAMKLALPRPRRSSAHRMEKMKLVASLAALTIVVGGAGAYLGTRLARDIEQTVTRRLENAPPSVEVKDVYAGGATLKRLAPIVTNLASPKNTWVRLEAALVVDAKSRENPDLLASTIAEDILIYLRSLNAAQLEGAAGLRYLREDLAERVNVRARGAVRELVIETLVVQ